VPKKKNDVVKTNEEQEAIRKYLGDDYENSDMTLARLSKK